MKPFTRHCGIAAPLPIANVDTDQIVPKQFLKTVERKGLKSALFYDQRHAADGTPVPGFVLDRAPWTEATILVAGDNFGCGSSREHAAWALADFGICCVISSRIADIFYNNSFKTGFLPIALKAEEVEALFQGARAEGYRLTVDLPAQTVSAAGGPSFRFDIDPFRKDCLVRGLDEIGLTLQQADAIRAYEARRRAEAPWLFA